MNAEELIEEINSLSKKEAWQKELILKSEYYYLRIICLYIKSLEVKNEVLHIILDNRRIYRVRLTDDFEYEIISRFDLNVIEDNKKKHWRR